MIHEFGTWEGAADQIVRLFCNLDLGMNDSHNKKKKTLTILENVG